MFAGLGALEGRDRQVAAVSQWANCTRCEKWVLSVQVKNRAKGAFAQKDRCAWGGGSTQPFSVPFAEAKLKHSNVAIFRAPLKGFSLRTCRVRSFFMARLGRGVGGGIDLGACLLLLKAALSRALGMELTVIGLLAQCE